MLAGMTGILAGFGLSAATGLNAYIPLLMVGLAARFTPWLKLSPPFDILTNEWVLGALVVLLAIEFFADKIPIVDNINDGIQTFVRPAAGAILFAANANVITNIHPVVAVILGLLVAFSVHATKATVRPVVTATTMGMGNPIVSTIEDITSFGLSFVAIVIPLALLFVFAGLLYVVWWLMQKRTRDALARATPAGDISPPLNWPQ